MTPVSGIKCDNIDCTFEDPSVKYEDYDDWLNKPCPVCSANLLTQEDYDICKQMEMLNNMVEKIPGLKELTESLTKEMNLDEKMDIPFNSIKDMFSGDIGSLFNMFKSQPEGKEEDKKDIKEDVVKPHKKTRRSKR